MVIKAIIPFQEVGAEIFSKIGASYINGNDSQDASNTTNLYYGFGADYYINPHMSIILQWTQVKNAANLGNLDLFSIGLFIIKKNILSHATISLISSVQTDVPYHSS